MARPSLPPSAKGPATWPPSPAESGAPSARGSPKGRFRRGGRHLPPHCPRGRLGRRKREAEAAAAAGAGPWWPLAAPAGCRGLRPVPRGQWRPGNNRPGSDVPSRRVQREAGSRLRAGLGKGRYPRAAEKEAGDRRARTEAVGFHFGN